MGCGGSRAIELAKADLEKKTIQSAQGLSWDRLAEVDSLTVASGKGSTSDGKELLSVTKTSDTVNFADAASGTVVFSVSNVNMGNHFSGKSSMWDVWAAKPAIEGQQAEGKDNLFKWGQFIGSPSADSLEYKDMSGQVVLKTKMLSSYDGLLLGADGSTVAVVKKADFLKTEGIITCAKGQDPLIAFMALISLLSVAG
eukprot:TRINITY_DN66931_c0_g1_i1.p1 TRINITY_DN66931_c0_g1~~TRINITY_DN66931_c0_g1_i1.p1  ORF type:complete len:198 (-),score=41.67 TRINITY_DN66931_c0_g1_i1:240-833(-)